jgi:hypothetical protein
MLKLMDKKDQVLMTQMQQEKTSVLTKNHKKWLLKHQNKNQFPLKLKVLASMFNLMTISKYKLKQKLTLKKTKM